MKKLGEKSESRLRSGLIAFCKLHFCLIALLIGQTILYDSSKLITPEVVLERWVLISGLLVIIGSIWYLVKSKAGHALMYKLLLFAMIVADIMLASYSVYSQRGMASKAVLLFVIPIVISGLLLSRSAVFATAILCIAAYSLAAVSYFVINFNEGYKVELYGEIGFYSLLMLLIAGLTSVLVKSRE
ncbi:MAG TPA: hypothetical protein VD947_04555 [Patescibacteria group bacterium]|nr:hypothetical protein [Patescibacteria group bacterium]